MPRAAKLKVKRWIQTGNLDHKHKHEDDILDDCGRLLDKAYSHEIIGDVVFQATNSKYYVITVEAVISRCAPEYLHDLLISQKEL